MAEQSIRSERLTVSVIMSPDMVYDLYCEVCSEDGKNLEAAGYCIDCQDYLCTKCFEGHKSTRISRNHILQDKTQMPHQKPSPSVAVPSRGGCTEKCACHPDRLVEYYCRDDKSLGCSVCMTVNHRLCNSVDYIPELEEHLLDSQEYKRFTNTLNSLNTTSQSVIKSTKENVIKAEKWFSDVEKVLQELRRKMIEAFDKFERDLKIKASTIKSADLKKLHNVSDKGEAIFDEVKRFTAELQSLQNKNQLGQLFIYMIQLEDKVATLHKLLADADTDNSATAYTLEAGFQIQEIIDDPTSIGKLSVQATARPKLSSSTTKPAQPSVAQSPVTAAPIAKDPKTMKTVPVRDIKVKTKSDTSVCWITGSALMPVNKLIIADFNNDKVKLLNLQTLKVISELKISLGTWDIASITADQVAVTLQYSSKIVFVKVTDRLKKDRDVPVDGVCSGILHNNGKLIVSFTDPVKIEIMTLDGTVEKKIETGWFALRKLFQYPSHMAFSLDCKTIYVSDYSGECVKGITLEGAAVAEYRDKDLSRPRGITVGQDGRVLVCGEGSGNINLLTPGLTKVKVLVDELYCPYSLSYCHGTDRLIIGLISDNVKVYQLP